LQEQIEREAVAITLKASKLTAKALAFALKKIGQRIKIRHQKAQTPQGKQSIKKLMNHNVPTNTIPIEGDKGLFEQVAR
jgi:DNA mismatch repair ATPase MutL